MRDPVECSLYAVCMARVCPPHPTPDRGDRPIALDGLSYLPRFLTVEDSDRLAAFFASLHPLWESRHPAGAAARRGGSSRLTRPVYWLGAWQFAALGYYAPPGHVRDRCVRAEPLPEVMTMLLDRLRPHLAAHGDLAPPNTCLINYYGSETPPDGPPVDRARLRMHRDAEPGAVVMLSIGQPAQFELLEPHASTPERSWWVRHRSVLILSGAEYKDRLYHRVARVRYGQEPVLHTTLPRFALRRVSVSFRHVPARDIHDLADLGGAARAVALPYIQTLAAHSPHFAAQLTRVSPG